MRAWVLLALGVAAAGCGNAVEVDADGDHIPASRDCNDHDSTVWRRLDLYRDADGDGAGDGDVSTQCIGADIPAGFAELGGDCAPGDAARWQRLAYEYRDADGDNYTVVERNSVCSGASLPSGYATVEGLGPDCDDGNATLFHSLSLYVDSDGDGFGAGAATTVCAGSVTPSGYAASTGDCAPDDGARWQLVSYSYRDVDGDGWTVPEQKVVCTGVALPAGYATSAGKGADCNDADATTHRVWAVYRDGDGDGFGVGALTTLCAADAVPAGYTALEGDCDDGNGAVWKLLSYGYRDQDGDTYTVAAPGTLCTNGNLPPGYLNGANGADCNDDNASQWRAWTLYDDGDDDSVGDGAAQQICANDTKPAGYALVGGDCAPADKTRWQNLAFTYRDADGDTYTVAQSGTLCSGAKLPDGYGNTAKGADCNDGDKTVWSGFDTYADSDNDGWGVSPAVRQCTDGSVPAGFALKSGDCAPGDDARFQLLSYQYVDRDDDTWTVAESGQVCTGLTLPKPYLTAAHGNDCNDHSADHWEWVTIYLDHDGDGVGDGTHRAFYCKGDTILAGYSRYGDDPDDNDPDKKVDEDLDDLLAILF